MPSTGYVLMGNWGCLLPLLIIFNLFFGRFIFNSTGLWLGVEAVLVLIFMIKIKVMVSRISRQFRPESPGSVADWPASQPHKTSGRIIDVQGQEIEGEKELR